MKLSKIIDQFQSIESGEGPRGNTESYGTDSQESAEISLLLYIILKQQQSVHFYLVPQSQWNLSRSGLLLIESTNMY